MMNSTTAPRSPEPAPSRLALYLDLIRWNRPAGWLLLLWPSLAALWIAADGFPGLHLALVFLLGTILMRSAGCCVNDVADREFDLHVKRTAQRPVTSGRVGVKEALLVGAALAFVAFLLVLTTNVATIVWSFAGLGLAVVYPYAKRHVSMPQAVLGVAFSFGIPMAFSAVNGGPVWEFFSDATRWGQRGFWSAVWHSVPTLAWSLMVANLFWVLAYDTEYAMVDRDDDLKIGMKTSAITLGNADVPAVIGFYLVSLGIWTAMLWDRVNPWVWGAMLTVALAQVAWHHHLIKDRARDGCFKAFRLNHWLGFTVFLGVVLGV
ncbi:4-hydroxybenzoate octaprenyltransferase [Hydrogenophaga crassostreae]|uniref:4-hydroxybenzoate octaprenyltransferase n=1 Tax=Hydrogenophaga crassostreae TaxID=1763535 RepID=A0A162VWM3_9BURK|nr:4-hydroxybenzoate octaprenyltransferase [Hydrogenophaga crassostreae]AOW12087.1 4-hydroxybenzoate octaprenyltransferase [Hydrogenophaga crassostreae]OAD41031.1 4-hydroxybenzoate octaprenyltransferase [Hydrogenophaga crassostreae]